jgi:hypothetical protein
MPHTRRPMLTGPLASGLLAAALMVAALIALPGAAAAGSVPAAAGTGGTILYGVSCTGSARCMAVGSRARTSKTTSTLAERWAGGRWHVAATRNPAGARSSFLIEVSCRSAASCVAVGSTTSKAHGTVALAEAWNGSAWRLTRPATPAGASSSELLDVSCTGGPGCMAVGDYRTAAHQLRPLAESWDGTRWRRLATPDRHGASAGILDGLYCRGARCKAVGFAQTSPFRTVGLAEAWNGSRWRVLAFPSPAMASFVGVQDVACGSSSACVAVGLAFAPATRSLAERWRAGKWRLVKAAARSPAEAMLNGVSCTAASSCMAVGESASGPALLAEAWNGIRWKVLKTPDPAAPTASFLNQVSCTRAAHCVAVGSRGSGKNAAALAEIWNGAAWLVLATPSP